MNKFDTIKNMLNTKRTKPREVKNSTGLGWEIGAYTIRGTSVVLPACIIMFMENSWVKSGIGLLATLLIISLVIIFKAPIKKAFEFAPGVIPFTVFIVIALFFSTASYALYTIGISGLAGSVAAVPLHLKYISSVKSNKSSEQVSLEKIAEALENLK